MKRYILTLLAFAGLLCFNACETSDYNGGAEDDGATTPQIVLSQQVVDAGVAADMYVVSVTADCVWEAECGVDWIALEKSVGAAGTEELAFSVALNEESAERKGKIVVKNSELGVSAELEILQRVASPSLEIEGVISVESDYKGATKTISVVANFEYDIEVTSSWIKCSQTADGAKIVVAANSNYEPRSAEVKIYSYKYGKEGAVVTVDQGACGCKIGDIMTVNKTNGIVFYIGDNMIKLVSVAATTSSKYSTEYVATLANDWYSGTANMAVIKARSSWTSKYPAFKWCSDRGTGWYLPARNELQELYNQKAVVDEVLLAQELSPLGEWLWSSTESTYSYAYMLNMVAGQWRYYNKDDANEVRAIYSF